MSTICKPKTGTKEWAEKNVNFLQSTCGTWKCRNNCIYCYAKGMAVRFHQIVSYDSNHQVPCGDPRIVMPKSYPHDTTIMMPSSHDLFPEHLPQILNILNNLLLKGNSVLLVSKPRREVIEAIITRLKKWQPEWQKRVEFRFSITSSSPEISLRYEPGAPLPQERVECLKMVLDAGFPASVSMEPYLQDPFLLLEYIAGTIDVADLKEFWIGTMNYGIPAELRDLYQKDFMEYLYSKMNTCKIVRWKDSFCKVLGIDNLGVRK